MSKWHESLVLYTDATMSFMIVGLYNLVMVLLIKWRVVLQIANTFSSSSLSIALIVIW